MSTNHTPNYDLSQWEPSDAVRREEFNADNAKIDEALGTLTSQVNSKAELSVLTAAMQSRNCQAVTTGYTGTGRAGEDTPNSLSFARRPMFIHVGGPEGSGFSAANGQTSTVCYANGGVRYIQLNWSGNGVSWYELNGGYSPSPAAQMNQKDKWYSVFALLGVSG